MNTCVKAIALCWYYNIQMLIGFTLQSISKEEQQKLTKGLPVHFQAVEFQNPSFESATIYKKELCW